LKDNPLFIKWLANTLISFVALIAVIILDSNLTFKIFGGEVGVFLIFFLAYCWWMVPLVIGLFMIIIDWVKLKFGK
jgi:hypothetical protein